MNTRLHVIESPFEIGSNEVLPLSFDVSRLLEDGETLSAPSAVLYNAKTGALYPAGLSGSPSIATTTTIRQTVHDLVNGQNYRLEITFTASTKTWTVIVDLHCVA